VGLSSYPKSTLQNRKPPMAEEPWTALPFTLYQGLTCADCALGHFRLVTSTACAEQLFVQPSLSLGVTSSQKECPRLTPRKSARFIEVGQRDYMRAGGSDLGVSGRTTVDCFHELKPDHFHAAMSVVHHYCPCALSELYLLSELLFF